MNKKVKIAHSLEELEDQVILTLVDQPILQQGKLDIDQEDVLQNDDIQLANQVKHNVQLKDKIHNIANAASSHLQAKNQGASGLLPHYDDYSYKPSTVQVEDGVVIKPKKGKKSKGLGSDYIQNDSSTVKLNSEYISRKQQKKANKASAKDLLNFLDDTAEDNKSTLKKQQQNIDVLRDSLQQIKKKRILDNSIKNIVQFQTVDDQQQSILLRSIERSRKKVQAQQPKYNVLQAIKEEDHQGQQIQNKTVQIQLNPIAYHSSQTVRKNKNIDLKEALNGTSSVMFAHLPSQKLAKKNEQVEETPMKFEDFSKKELNKMRKQVQFLEDKQIGIGLAGTLAYLRQNSMLGQEEQVGRHNDKQVSYNDPNDRIKLEYRNASGKLMKPKEAYRYICAKFHGEGPSKNKVQIRKKRQLQQMRIKQKASEGGQMLKLLQSHQQKSGQAHMTINLGSKSRQ